MGNTYDYKGTSQPVGKQLCDAAELNETPKPGNQIRKNLYLWNTAGGNLGDIFQIVADQG